MAALAGLFAAVDVEAKAEATSGTGESQAIADGTVMPSGTRPTVGRRDPDGNALTYMASSYAPGVATVSLSGSILTVTPVAGESTAAATGATGSSGAATQSFVLTMSNQGPVAVGTLADRSLPLSDGSVAVDVSGAFADPDGDALTYLASSSEARVATVSVLGSVLTVTPMSAGEITVTVAATDASGSRKTATQAFTVTVQVDYDSDDDGLIEITTLAQLDAVRFDLDGDSVPTASEAAAYAAAFPGMSGKLSCPAAGCTGYELVTALDFDTNGSGRADAGDAYWRNGSGWSPIGTQSQPFAATFEGNGHTIGGLFMRGDDEVGLIGNAGRSSVIRSVGLVAVDVRGVTTGGLVGTNSGTIASSYSSGRVSSEWLAGGLVGINTGAVRSSYSSAQVSGVWHIGGLVGSNFGGRVTASYATGRVSGDTSVGGLVGSNTNSGRVTSSYATGPVSGSTDVGGLVGSNTGVVSASYWDTSTSGRTAGSGGSGQPTSALQGPTAYAGLYSMWDVDVDGDGTSDSPWTFGTGSQYPVLVVDMDGDGQATWQEFGRQLRAGPALTAAEVTGTVVLTWTVAEVSARTSSPTLTYVVYRATETMVEKLAAGLTGLSYTDTSVAADVTYTYQVAAGVSGGEAGRSRWATPGSNQAPVTIGSLANRALGLAAGSVTVDVLGAFSDPEDDALTYAALSSSPAVATVLISGSVLTVTPLTPGATTVRVTATDAGGSGGTATLMFVVTVSNGAPVAVGTVSDRTLRVSGGPVLVELAGAFSDPDGDVLTYAAMSSSPGVAAVSVSGSSLTVTPLSSGAATVTVTTTDGSGTATQVFVVTVPNAAPVAMGRLADRTLHLSDGPVSVEVAGAFSDPDEDSLTYGAVSSSPGVAAVSMFGLSLTVTPLSSGVSMVTVTATDAGGSGNTATQSFVVTVPNRSPVAAMALRARALLVADGVVAMDVSAAFTDPDGDVLTYGANSSDSSVATVSVSGSVLELTPVVSGGATMTVTATDASGSNASATQSFAVAVVEAGVDYDVRTGPHILDAPVGEQEAVLYRSTATMTPVDANGNTHDSRENKSATFNRVRAPADYSGPEKGWVHLRGLDDRRLGSLRTAITATDLMIPLTSVSGLRVGESLEIGRSGNAHDGELMRIADIDPTNNNVTVVERFQALDAAFAVPQAWSAGTTVDHHRRARPENLPGYMVDSGQSPIVKVFRTTWQGTDVPYVTTRLEFPGGDTELKDWRQLLLYTRFRRADGTGTTTEGILPWAADVEGSANALGNPYSVREQHLRRYLGWPENLDSRPAASRQVALVDDAGRAAEFMGGPERTFLQDLVDWMYDDNGHDLGRIYAWDDRYNATELAALKADPPTASEAVIRSYQVVVDVAVLNGADPRIDVEQFSIRPLEWADLDGTRHTATDLGELSAATEVGMQLGTVDVDGDHKDYYEFTVDAPRQMQMTLTGLSANADLYLEQEEGYVLRRSISASDSDDSITMALAAGTYFLRVTAEASGTISYQLRYGPVPATPPLSDDATLSGLSLSGINIGTFASGKRVYTADVDNSVETTTVTAAATQAAATVAIADGNGSTAGGSRTVALAEGANTITVTVTAEDGVTTQAYTVTVTRAARPLSDDATLSGLSLSGVNIGTFASGTTAYTADVDNSVETTTVTATATQAAATVTVTDGNGSTAGGTRTVALAEGANTITVRVTAEDGVATMAYTVTVTRAPRPLSSDATLSGLSLSGVAIGTFRSDLTAYTADVEHLVETTTVTAMAAHQSATVVIADSGGSVTNGARTVALAVGSNTITVTVTAEDGVTIQAYTVTVMRAVPPLSDDATLSGLGLSGLNIGTFASDTTAYMADVDHERGDHHGDSNRNPGWRQRWSIADADGSTADALADGDAHRGGEHDHGDGHGGGRSYDRGLHSHGDPGGAPAIG